MIREIGEIHELGKIIELSEGINEYRKKRFVDEIGLKLNEQIAEIIQNSVTLFDLGYTDLRNNTEEIRKHLACFTKIQNNLNYALGYVNFNTLSQIIWNAIRKTRDYTERIIEIVTEEKTNMWTSLIPLWNLRDSFIQVNKDALKENCSIPIQTNEYLIHKYLKLSLTSTRITGNILKIKIKIPTYTTKDYIVYQAIPLPFKYRNSTYLMTLNSDYYLTRHLFSNGRIESTPLTALEYDKCTKLGENTLCNPSSNTQFLRMDEIQTIADLFMPDPNLCSFNGTEMERKQVICNVKVIQHKNAMVKLDELFFYIYVLESMRVTIKCVNLEYSKVFDDSQYVRLDNTCKGEPEIIFGNGEIKPHGTILAEQSDTIVQGAAKMNIMSHDLLKKENITFRNMTRETRDLQPDFAELRDDISKYKEILQVHAPNLKLKDSTLNSLLGLIFIFFCITWAFMGYMYWKTKLNTKLDEFRIPIVGYHKNMSPDKVSYRTSIPALNCNIERTLSNLLSESDLDPIYQDSPLRHGILNPNFPIHTNENPNEQDFSSTESHKEKNITWNLDDKQSPSRSRKTVFSPASVDIIEPTIV